MEAITGASRGGIAGCSYTHRDSFAPSASKNGNSVLPVANYYASSRRGSLRMVRQIPFSSIALQDEAHVHYYLSAQQRARKDRLMTSVLPKAIAGVDEAVVEERIRDKEVKAKKMEMKMEKKRIKAARDSADQSSSSSSSSSSESEGETIERPTRKKRVNSENLWEEWASISQSPLMNSIPTISSSFVIEQPSATAQQLASPGPSSVAAQQAETHVRRNSHRREISRRNEHPRQPSMADATVPRSPSAGAAHLEVCMGGKCKKAGAEEVLSAFNANGVNASACNKCMKKCKFAVNVLVHPDGDDVPQMYSSIGVQDVNALSRKYFGTETASREAIEV